MGQFTQIPALTVLLAMAGGVAPAVDSEFDGVQHVTVRHEPGRCFGWPANGGIWSWGDEILVQYKDGEFQDKRIGSHDINYSKPILCYTRNALLPDGKVVTIYYWHEDEKAERDIAATIWTPPTE